MLTKPVPLNEMIKLGKLIPPSREIVAIELRSFDVESQTWLDPIEVRLSLSKQKFAGGGCRDAFMATGLTGLSGKMVLQKYRKEIQENIANLFTSVEKHTRTAAPMQSFGRHYQQTTR